MTKLTLKTSNKEFHELHKIVDAARAGATTVKVPKLALWNLLQDHSALAGALRGNYTEPADTTQDTAA